MEINGACLCGNIQYVADVDPDTATICHCEDCQVNSGSAFGYVIKVRNNNFNLEKGKLSFFIKTAESGSKRELGFCGICGTRIYKRPVMNKTGFFELRLGTVSQRNQLTPKRQIWKRSALNWTSVLETNLNLDKQ